MRHRMKSPVLWASLIAQALSILVLLDLINDDSFITVLAKRQ